MMEHEQFDGPMEDNQVQFQIKYDIDTLINAQSSNQHKQRKKKAKDEYK